MTIELPHLQMTAELDGNVIKFATEILQGCYFDHIEDEWEINDNDSVQTSRWKKMGGGGSSVFAKRGNRSGNPTDNHSDKKL